MHAAPPPARSADAVERAMRTTTELSHRARRWVAVLGVVVAVVLCALVWSAHAAIAAAPVSAALVFAAGAVAAGIQIGLISAGPVRTIGAGGVVLGMLLVAPSFDDTVQFTVWAVGVAAGTAVTVRRPVPVVVTTAGSMLAGAALIAAVRATPPLTADGLVADSQPVQLAAGILAYFAIFALLGLILNRLLGRSWRAVVHDVGWLRWLALMTGQGVTAYLGRVFALFVVYQVSSGATSLPRVTELAVFVLLAVGGGFYGIREIQARTGRLTVLMEATLDLPWPSGPAAAAHALSYLALTRAGFGGAVLREDEAAPGGALISEEVDAGPHRYRLALTRRAWQRPFTLEDTIMLNALASVFRETQRVDRETTRIRELADTDELTGALNYRAFVSALRALSERTGDQGVAACIFINVNDFKSINARYGHSAGNEVLRQVAARLRQTAAPHNPVVARIGPDEFAVAVVGLASREAAEDLAMALDDSLGEPVTTEAGLVAISSAVGVATAQTGKDDLSALVSQAEERVFAARSRFQAPREGEATTSPTHATGVVEAIRTAVVGKRLSQVYQPIIDLESGTIVACEAAVRYHDPVHGDLPVPVILGESARLGLLDDLSVQMVEQGLADMERFRAAGARNWALHVNIDVGQLTHARLQSGISQLLDEHRETPVVLELTEFSMRRADEEAIRDAMTWAQRRGVALAMDGVGTEYSEVLAFVRCPTQQFKVDRGILADVMDPRAGQVVTDIVSAGARIGATVVFEGVEREEQVDMLRANGARYAQGFHLIRPMRAAELLVRLESLGNSLDAAPAS